MTRRLTLRFSRYAIDLMSGELEWSRLRNRMQDGSRLSGNWNDWSVPEGKITVGPVTVTVLFNSKPGLTSIPSAEGEARHKVEISRNTLEIKRSGYRRANDRHFSFDCYNDKKENKGAFPLGPHEVDCFSVDDLSIHGYEYETYRLSREITATGSCQLMDTERKF